MKVYILDTDILTLFERGHPSVVARVGQTPFHEIGITVITAEEQIRGRLAQIRRYSSNRSRTQEYLESYRTRNAVDFGKVTGLAIQDWTV